MRERKPSPRVVALGVLVTLIVALFFATDALAMRRFGGEGTQIKGKYKALVIWVEDYEHWTRLNAPKKDAQRIAKVLTERYLFDPADVEIVANPNLSELFTAIKSAAVKAGKDDSLLIFFAGHGYLEKETGQGYWIPRDGLLQGDAREVSFLSSTWVRDVLKRSKAKHVAVVSDSCFSGALLGSRGGARSIDDKYYGKMYKRRSFEGLTSGALETVADAGAPGGHSPFAYYFATALESPDSKVFDLQDVFMRVRSGVKQYSKQTPLFGKIAGTPSDGGSFVFVSKEGVEGGAVAAKPAPKPAEVASAEPKVLRGVEDTETVERFGELSSAISKRDFDDALRIALRANFCEKGHLKGCMALASFYMEGVGTAKDPARAEGYYGKANTMAKPACTNGNEFACYVIGANLVHGRAVAADVAKGLSHLQTACDLGHAGACALAADTYADVQGQPAKALPFYAKGCRTGSSSACQAAGYAYLDGRGTSPDKKKAETFFADACEGGELKGCGEAAHIVLDRAAQMSRSNKKARNTVFTQGVKYAAFGCKKGDLGSCVALGDAELMAGHEKAAQKYWATACNKGSGTGCAALGAFFFDDSDPDAMRMNDAGKAIPWFTKGCELGDGFSCRRAGFLYADGQVSPENIEDDGDAIGRAFYERGCKAGDPESCQAIGQ